MQMSRRRGADGVVFFLAMIDSSGRLRLELGGKGKLPSGSISWYHEAMAKSTRDTTKSHKPRPKGTGEPVMVRLQPELAAPLDDWRRQQQDLPSRAEAIRRLVELGLKAKGGKR
jgi:hypothetical protein